MNASTPSCRLSLGVVAIVGGLLISPFRATAASSVTVASGDTSVTIQALNGQPAVTNLIDRTGRFDWVGGAEQAIALPLIQNVQIDGHPVALHWHSVEATDKPAAGEGDMVFKCDEPALELHSLWSGRPGPGPVEHRVVILNRGKVPVLLPVQESLAVGLHAPAGHALEQWWVEKGAGTPTDQGTHREPLNPGKEQLLRCWPSGRDTPRDAIPWTTVQDVDGHRGVYVGVEYTARVQIAL
jgi:hypothetical protein